MENTLTADGLKRRGVAAIGRSLAKRPIHLYKHNRCAAVVLSESEYQKLVASCDDTPAGMIALEWLLAHPVRGKRTCRDIDQTLRGERSW